MKNQIAIIATEETFLNLNQYDNIEVGKNVRVVGNLSINISPDSKLMIKNGTFFDFNSSINVTSGSLIIHNNAIFGCNSYIQCNSADIIVGENVKFGFSNMIKAEKATIEINKNCTISNFVCIHSSQGRIVLRPNTKIEDYCRLYSETEKGKIYIGEMCKIDARNELRALGEIHLGPKCHLWSGSYVSAFDQPYIFKYRVTLGQQCVVAGRGPLKIEKLTMIGGKTFIVTENHNNANPFLSIREQSHTQKGIFIDKDAWVASSCVLLDGINIGNRAMIGGGSVVTRNIPAYKVAFGNPARIIKDRREAFYNFISKNESSPDFTNFPPEFLNWINENPHSDIEDLKSFHDEVVLNKKKPIDFNQIINKIIVGIYKDAD